MRFTIKGPQLFQREIGLFVFAEGDIESAFGVVANQTIKSMAVDVEEQGSPLSLSSEEAFSVSLSAI